MLRRNLLRRNLEGESLSEKVFAENSGVMSENLFRKALTFEIRPHAGNHRQKSLRFQVLLPHKKWEPHLAFIDVKKRKEKKKIAEDQVLAVGCAEKYACLVDDRLYTTAQAHGCTDDRARARMQSKPPAARLIELLASEKPLPSDLCATS